MSAKLRDKLHLASRLPQHLVCWSKANRQTDDIAFNFFRFADQLEFVVEFLDDRSLDYILAYRCLDSMSEKNWDSEPADLCRVDPVTSDLRKASRTAAISTPACIS
jgi:hypothetical protein